VKRRQEATLIFNRIYTPSAASRYPRRSLTVFGIIALIFSLLSISAMGFTAYRAYESYVEERLGSAARALESVGRYVERQYETMDLATLRMLELIDRRNLDTIPSQDLRYFKRQIEAPLVGGGLEVQVWLADGSNAIDRGSNITIIDDEAFRVHLFPEEFLDGGRSLRHASSGLAIARPVMGRTREGPLLPVSRIILDGAGRPAGVVTVTVPTAQFLSVFSALRTYEHDAFVLARNDYLGMVREPNNDAISGKFIPTAILFQNYPAAAAGRYEGAAISDGIRRVGVHLGLAPLPLVLGHSLEIEAIGWQAFYRAGPVLLVGLVQLVSAVGFSFVAFVAFRRVVLIGKKIELARAAAEASEARLRQVLVSANDGILILDSDLRVRMFNRSAENIFGYPHEDMLGNSIDRLIPNESRSRHAELVVKFTTGSDGTRAMGNWRVVRALRASGDTFPASISITKSTLQGEATYLVVLRDMSDVEQAETSLRQAAAVQMSLREGAEQANRAKSDFLAAVSHELRTPLNAIIGFSDFLKSGAGGKDMEDHRQEYLGYIHQSGEHLLSVINDILDLTKIQGGKTQLHIEHLPVDQLIEAAIRMSLPAAIGRGIEIDRLGVWDEVRVHADDRALRQVLLNLVGNAVKFSPDKGRIVIEASTVGISTRIRVADEGPGMPPELISRIGTPFLQDENSYVKSKVGTGLGLAISVGLLRAMDGRLEISNRRPVGLEACVVLPG
jgi:PAS domain S-box-containing protein